MFITKKRKKVCHLRSAPKIQSGRLHLITDISFYLKCLVAIVYGVKVPLKLLVNLIIHLITLRTRKALFFYGAFLRH